MSLGFGDFGSLWLDILIYNKKIKLYKCKEWGDFYQPLVKDAQEQEFGGHLLLHPSLEKSVWYARSRIPLHKEGRVNSPSEEMAVTQP